MPPIRSYIERHHPRITPRIEFYLKSRPPLPRITPRHSFDILTHPRYDDDLTTDIEQPVPAEIPTSHPVPDAVPERQRQRSRSPSPVAGPSTTSSTVPKPKGEPGRPNSGGFCLEQSLMDLNWSKEDIEKFNVCFFFLLISRVLTNSKPSELSSQAGQQVPQQRSELQVSREGPHRQDLRQGMYHRYLEFYSI